MSDTRPIMVKYGTLCDMVQEIIYTEDVPRTDTRASLTQRATWQAEMWCAQRMVSYVMSGGLNGSGRYSTAFGYLDTRIRQATVLPPSGSVVIGLRVLMGEMT